MCVVLWCVIFWQIDFVFTGTFCFASFFFERIIGKQVQHVFKPRVAYDSVVREDEYNTWTNA